jgi:hypothetical protein
VAQAVQFAGGDAGLDEGGDVVEHFGAERPATRMPSMSSAELIRMVDMM